MLGIETARRWWLLMAVLLVGGSAAAEPQTERSRPLRPSLEDIEGTSRRPSPALSKYYKQIARLAVRAAALEVEASVQGQTRVVWLGKISVTREMRAVRRPASVIVERTTERTDTATGHTRTTTTRWHISSRGLGRLELERSEGRAHGESRRLSERKLGHGDQRFERARAGIERALRNEGVLL
jgi:hypothetical protein